MHDHITPVKIYVGVWGTLLLFTLVTTLVSFLDLGPWNIVIALLIATTKATLVVLIFMHVKWSSPLTKLFVVGALLWLAVLLGITLSDYYSRGWLPLGRWW
jgi:cytochrome c oxidase subunit 4